MSYIQGTDVELEARFSSPDPANPRVYVPYDPPEVRLTIKRPDGTVQQFTRTGGGLARVGPGHYTYRLDTSPATGTWEYQFENPGESSTVQRKQITVRSRIGAL